MEESSSEECVDAMLKWIPVAHLIDEIEREHVNGNHVGLGDWLLHELLPHDGRQREVQVDAGAHLRTHTRERKTRKEKLR